MKILLPNFLLNYKCNKKGCCCRGWKITFKEFDFQRIKQRVKGTPFENNFDSYFKFSSPSANSSPIFFRTIQPPIFSKRFGDGYASIIFDERGTCPFLTGDGKCSIHSNFGEIFLPEICVNFPVIGLETPLGIEIYFEFICPSVYGTLIDFKEKASIIEIEGKWKREVYYYSYDEPLDKVLLKGDEYISFEEFDALRKIAIKIITSANEPFLKKLSRVNFLITSIIENRGFIYKEEGGFIEYMKELLYLEASKSERILENLRNSAHFLVNFQIDESLLEKIKDYAYQWEFYFEKYLLKEENNVSDVFSNYLVAKFFALPLQHEDSILSSYTYLNHVIALAFIYFSLLSHLQNQKTSTEIAATSLGISEYFFRSVNEGYLNFSEEKFKSRPTRYNFSDLLER